MAELGGCSMLLALTRCVNDWFNNRRLLEPIGNIPPAEAEANHYSQVLESAISA